MTKCVAMAIALLSAGSAAAAQTAKPLAPIEYSGTTAGLAPGSGVTLTFRILKWSTAEDRQRVLQVLTGAKEMSGTPDLTKLLANNPSVGHIWTEGPGGYALKYTYREELPGGVERIVVITDRPIGAINPPGPWKAEGQTADVAPFTIIEMHVTKDGKGEGKMSLGVPFTIDPGDHTVDLSNYAAAPVTIRNVQLKRGV